VCQSASALVIENFDERRTEDRSISHLLWSHRYIELKVKERGELTVIGSRSPLFSRLNQLPMAPE
jgi:hypothetical protein